MWGSQAPLDYHTHIRRFVIYILKNQILKTKTKQQQQLIIQKELNWYEVVLYSQILPLREKATVAIV